MKSKHNQTFYCSLVPSSQLVEHRGAKGSWWHQHMKFLDPWNQLLLTVQLCDPQVVFLCIEVQLFFWRYPHNRPFGSLNVLKRGGCPNAVFQSQSKSFHSNYPGQVPWPTPRLKGRIIKEEQNNIIYKHFIRCVPFGPRNKKEDLIYQQLEEGFLSI